MANNRLRFGLWAIVCLVALRVTVGWHFFKEGTVKLRDPDFSSKSFLQISTGPLAGLYHAQMPDAYGHERLNRERTLSSWTAYRDRVVNRLKLDENGAKEADRILGRFRAALNEFFGENNADIKEYFLELERLGEMRKATTKNLNSQYELIAKKDGEIWAKPVGWYNELEKLNQNYQQAMLALAPNDKAASRIKPLPDYENHLVNAVVTWWVFGVGVLLVLGLFTRFASVAGAAFLLSVLTTQPFWVKGATPTYYQAVELVACLLLAATAAGRFAGLDFFVHALRMRCCPPKKGTDHELNS